MGEKLEMKGESNGDGSGGVGRENRTWERQAWGRGEKSATIRREIVTQGKRGPENRKEMEK